MSGCAFPFLLLHSSLPPPLTPPPPPLPLWQYLARGSPLACIPNTRIRVLPDLDITGCVGAAATAGEEAAAAAAAQSTTGGATALSPPSSSSDVTLQPYVRVLRLSSIGDVGPGVVGTPPDGVAIAAQAEALVRSMSSSGGAKYSFAVVLATTGGEEALADLQQLRAAVAAARGWWLLVEEEEHTLLVEHVADKTQR